MEVVSNEEGKNKADDSTNDSTLTSEDSRTDLPLYGAAAAAFRP